MKISVQVIFIFLLTFFADECKAQLYWENAEFFSTRNGLPNNCILSIHQDKKGFLWIGSYNGLSRYDGKEFKLYKNSFINSPDWIFSVTAIAEDSSGNIYIGTRGGILAKLDRATEKWTSVHLKGKDITSIEVDNDGIIWASNRIGEIIRIENSKIKIFPVNDYILSLSPNNVNSFFTISSVVRIFDKRTKIFHSFPIKSVYSDTAISGVTTGESRIYFFFANKSIVSYHKSTGKSSMFFLPEDFEFDPGIHPSAVLKNGNLIAYNSTTLIELNSAGELQEIIELEDDLHNLNKSFVNIIKEDNSGILWIGTNAGLFKLDKNKFHFKKITSHNKKHKIKHNYIRSVYSIGNELWIGSREGQLGRLLIDTNNNEIIKEKWFTYPEENRILKNNYTTNTITSDKSGNIWAAGREGIFVLKKGKEDFEKINLNPLITGFSVTDVWSVFPDNKGNLLVGFARGLFRLELKNRKTKLLQLNNRKNYSVWNIFQSSDKRIWIGCSDGLYVADSDGNYNFKKFHLRTNAGDSLRDIWSMTEDKNGNIWIGSTGYGVFVLNKSSNKVTNYTEKEGLADDITSSILIDAYGNVWIGTVNGLSCFNPKNQSFKNYDEEDGLLSNDFNFKAAVYTTWGEMYFGSKVGLSSFYPGKIKPDNFGKVQIQITDLKVSGEEYPDFDNKRETIVLPFDNNNLSLRFAILDYRKTFAHSYRYILRGFDKKWNYSDYNNASAVYTNLPPGHYRFIVQGLIGGKVISTNDAYLNFVIEAAWWQEPVVWFSVFIILSLALFLLLRFRTHGIINKEREKSNIQRAMAELEMKALRAQMNPHFIFNAISAIQHYIVKEDILLANEYLSRFARLMRLFLESSRDKYISLSNEIHLLDLYISLEKLRFEEKFNFTIEIENNISHEEIKIPSMLLQPFVENAVNHGLIHKENSGILRINFSVTDNHLKCIIEDNGVGRKAAEILKRGQGSHNSLGTKLVEERVRSFLESDELEIKIKTDDIIEDNGNLNGTRVTVLIPLKNQEILYYESTRS